MTFISCSNPEIKMATRRQMSSTRASGEDGINVAMLRITFSVVGPHLLAVVNRTIRDGQLPPEWKVASVTPRFKSGSAMDVNNYHTVSILPTVSKLAERVVCNQLMSYLMTHDVLCPEQHGFRPAHSTESAQLDAVSYISTNRDEGRSVSLIAAPTHLRLLTASSTAGSWRNWAGTASVRTGSRTGLVTECRLCGAVRCVCL